jgi:S-adenosylmethionine:tRNA ribosyltransferase-isomerase
LHYRRADRSIRHLRFSELPDLLNPTDLLVFNDALVIPARFALRKSTGGRIEGLFVSEPSPGRWIAMLKNLGAAAPGTKFQFENAPEITARLLATIGEGQYEFAIDPATPAHSLLDRIGRMPLPPYIKRGKTADPRDALDRQRYQTIYSRASGAVAAPTAGLHFTPELLNALDSQGIDRAMVTLHVGLGTFKPIAVENLADHPMHSEAYAVDETAAGKLERARLENRRIVAVGTTSARVLESHPANEPWRAKTGQTSIFIYPPYDWRHIGALITNFHLPRSTLIALVAAMTGLDEQRRIYAEAIKKQYRFFSYGDAMLIE